MVSIMEMFIRVFFYCLQKLDMILNLFGHKLYAVTSHNILSGLTADETKEAEMPYNANLIRDLELGFRNDNKAPVKERYILVVTVKEWLRTSVKIKRALKEYPGAIQTPVIKPIIIVGPTRTGTTFLHHLLSQDPQLFAPMLWELKNPTPPGRPESWRQCDRYLTMKKQIYALRVLMYDKTYNIHQVNADNPEECAFALGLVLSQVGCFTRLADMDRLEERYYNQTHEEMVAMYKHYKMTLQLIAYKGMAGKRFVLKSPVHLPHLDALLEVFPDACLVFTHRSLSTIVPSTCSLIYHLSYGLGEPDKNYGQKIVTLMSYWTNRGVSTMKKYDDKERNDNPFCHIDYSALMKNPMEVIRFIYKRSDLDFSPDIQERFRKWISDNPKNKHGHHLYALADYGLSGQDIRDNFKSYIEYMAKHDMAVL